MSLTIAIEPPTGVDARRLMDGLNADLGKRYPEYDGTPYDPASNDHPHAVFLVARLDNEAVGCVALRPMNGHSAELKRMFVSDRHRQKGIARQLLVRMTEVARTAGYAELWLETGVRQPEAIMLYEQFGFQQIPNFSPYENDPLSVCMKKNI